MRIEVLRKIDLGMIMLEASKDDIEALQPILEKGYEIPAIKISVYKNRRGKYKGILMWCKEDRGCCRIEPVFVTNWNYQFCEVPDMQILVQQESAF